MTIFHQWLQTEALQNNPKIEVTPDGTRFAFKPVYKIKDGKTLLRLLKQQDLKGLGGVLLEEVQESLPHCEKALKSRASEIVYITRPIDKKKVLFYNDRSANLTVRNVSFSFSIVRYNFEFFVSGGRRISKIMAIGCCRRNG